ncbi:MAG: hypothetical protein JSR64_17480 [Nitrospira sp.]|nr:hypothetical protein [Nitrospira sp.]
MAELQKLTIKFGRYEYTDQQSFVVLAYVEGAGSVYYEFDSEGAFALYFKTPAVFFNTLLEHPSMNVDDREWRQQDYYDEELNLLNHVVIVGAWPWNVYPCQIPVDDAVQVHQPWKFSSAPLTWGLTRVTSVDGYLMEGVEATRTIWRHPEVMDRLFKQLLPDSSGMSCIARLHGLYGVLYERRFCWSGAADAGAGSVDAVVSKIKQQLMMAVWDLASRKYGQLEFAVPKTGDDVYPRLWVFIPDSVLTAKERDVLVCELSDVLRDAGLLEVHGA